MPRLRIGCSGWHYRHFRGVFYPDRLPSRDMLRFYAAHFSSAEVNNSFYKLPEVSTFRQWRLLTPEDFLFAVKASRFLTHMKKLKDPEAPLRLFFSRARALREKLGPVLFQLPPHWHLNLERFEHFLKALPRGHRYAIEFRDPTWLVPEVNRLLEAHGVAFCIYELEGFLSPLTVTADFVYIRLHGSDPKAKYRGSYHGRLLSLWERRIRAWLKADLDVYLYFDNDVGGAAVLDALELQRRFELGPALRSAA